MKKVILITVVFFSLLISAFCSDYIIAAQKFDYSRGQTTNAVTDATSELLPQQILSNINSQAYRSVLPDEQLERNRYQSRQDRYSLYLQLSSEYKKRDALFLENYSDADLKKQIQIQTKKINEIEKKIQDNIDEQIKSEQELEEKLSKFQDGKYTLENSDKTELEKYSSLIKNLFVKDEVLVSIENIKFYRDEKTALYTPSEVAKNAGYTSPVFEKEIVNAKINALITGKITSYGNYTSVTVKAYTYPGSKLIGTVTEVGSKNELDFISANIARQLIPIITNSMKISVEIDVEPKKAPYQIFIDDSLQKNITDKLILDSGVHNIQVVAEGYEGVTTKYYFDGNEYFKIEVNLVESKIQNLHLTLINPVQGTIYANSIPGVEKENNISEIKINDTSVLGSFIDEKGLTTFYYLPKQNITSDELLYFSAVTKNKDEYIDSRRKWMYTGYTSLMISLIPTFFTNGQRQIYENLGKKDVDSLAKENGWNIAFYACTAITVTAGIFWGVELVRYLMAANSAIPETPKVDKNGKLAEKQKKNLLKSEKEAAKALEKKETENIIEKTEIENPDENQNGSIEEEKEEQNIKQEL